MAHVDRFREARSTARPRLFDRHIKEEYKLLRCRVSLPDQWRRKPLHAIRTRVGSLPMFCPQLLACPLT